MSQVISGHPDHGHFNIFCVTGMGLVMYRDFYYYREYLQSIFAFSNYEFLFKIFKISIIFSKMVSFLNAFFLF